MPTSALIVAASLAAAVPVLHAGEWRIVEGDKAPAIMCRAADTPLDRAFIPPAAKAHGLSCRMTRMSTVGAVTSFSEHCALSYILQVTTSGTVTATGPDAFVTRAHSHGQGYGMDTGQPFTIPDTDTTITSTRLGPCKPGDPTPPP